ncbi:OLC1v1014947C1 [Oldenlandia corymbosa var. corymbosa]|uniref:OLC1v1014947C1 n=1 Tax=Oldenlandia corymbosa var. corymbosa TaxID=529605 RepID=A0AAV1E2H7_OLDCO|nr:OLC1v1014947C1 [Oldenlandia corymbosa var. corymbosa]
MEEASIGTTTTTTVVVDSGNKADERVYKGNVEDQKSERLKRNKKGGGGGKPGRFDRCFSSYAEISSPSPDRPLETVDSNKFKEDIRKWAKNVAGYARQLSDRFGGSGGSSSRQ